MLDYIVRQQEASKIVTLRMISKRFQIPTAEAYEQLLNTNWGSEYAIEILGEAKGDTIVRAYKPEIPFEAEDAIAEQPVTDELMDSVLTPDRMEAEADPYAGIEAEIEAHIMPVKASRKVDASYTRYETLEAAEAALGYQLISVAELHKACNRWGVKVNRMVKALCGDRGLGEPRSAEWKPVLVGRSRHVALSCVEDLKNL